MAKVWGVDSCIPCERRFAGSRPHRLRHFPQREKRRGGEGEGFGVFLADADGAGSVAELF